MTNETKNDELETGRVVLFRPPKKVTHATANETHSLLEVFSRIHDENKRSLLIDTARMFLAIEVSTQHSNPKQDILDFKVTRVALLKEIEIDD